MSAICGILPFRAYDRHAAICRTMLAAQAVYGPDDQSMVSTHKLALGRALYRLLPEDDLDVQPLRGGGGRYLLVADIRIDNRDDILASIGSSQVEGRSLSDSALLLAAFERWGEGVFDRLVGAYAVAIWDAEQARLILARDPTGQRPLHYHSAPGFFAFSSTPLGLNALPEIPRVPDEERLVEFISGLTSDPERTFISGIKSVLNGHVLVVSEGGVQSRKYWDPSLDYLRLARADDYVDAYREQLDRSVGAQLRGSNGVVASHLSSGFDSSAVASTAARLLAPSGGQVLAITSAPRMGFDGGVPRGRIADESLIAAQTAALHPNMKHIVIRPAGERMLDILDRPLTVREEPLAQICNNHWWRAVNATARERGARILLTGEAGNMTISAGNIYQLSEMVDSGRWSAWLTEARALVAGGTIRWRGVLAASFGAWMPRTVWNALNTAFLGTSRRLGPDLLVGAYWRERLAHRESAYFDSRLPKKLRAARLKAVQSVSPGNYRKQGLAAWGIDERDPTADRRIVEFCLSLPPEMLLSGGLTRALARRALADRLPRAVLYNPVRGLQAADWHELVGPADAAQILSRVQDSEAVRRVVDVDRLRAMIDNWPTSGFERYSVIGEYRQMLLKTLSAAHFLRFASSAESQDGAASQVASCAFH